VLSSQYRPLSHFFRQNFSQVTNPPIDSLREYRVMSLKTRFGNLKNVLDEDSSQTEILVLDSPFVANAQFDEMVSHFGDSVVRSTAPSPPDGAADALRRGLERIRSEAEDAVRSGAGHIILTDQGQDETNVPMPMILATSAVHSWLTRQGSAHLLLAQRAVGRMHRPALLRGAGGLRRDHGERLSGAGFHRGPDRARPDRRVADRGDGALPQRHRPGSAEDHVEDGDFGDLLLPRRSELRGRGPFARHGGGVLPRHDLPHLGDRRVGLQKKVVEVHARGWLRGQEVLPIGGFYKARRSGEKHAWEAQTMHMLQMACNKASYELWKQYSAKLRANPPIHLRDLLDIKPLGAPVPIEEVESITSIRKRFVTPGMSLGALSPEAHKTLNVAMNRIGAKSDSGEGGEDPAHFVPEPNGDNPSAKIKQVASGRFGVTAEYLNHCEELEIKVAQGAKPGEGGQLPGMKVTKLIARLRHSTKGVTLISPPPHHDIYSIEDLAQLIYDLKQINPRAKVTVKLVASSGVGTIAAGVAKAKADVILISGHNGGTGASPATSIKYAGLPWEMGLTEAHQVLAMNNLRDRVTLAPMAGCAPGATSSWRR
jgi:glutamate synthase (NADPH/NADH) large chain